MVIKSWPLSDRPRERLARYGSEVLSSVELLALLLGSGTAKSNVLELASALLCKFSSLDQLAQASVEELGEVKGIGFAKAVQLKAAFALAQRVQLPKEELLRVDQTARLAELIRPELESKKTEAIMVLLSDVKGVVFHREIIAVGTLTEVLLHPREVFYPAIRRKAYSVILAHNHPSGDPTPSIQDGEMTQKMREAGKTLGILLFDHLIIGTTGWFSFRNYGLM